MRIWGVLACLFLLGGCVGYGIAEGVSVMSTEKSLGDHAVSLYSGKNCSSVRLEQGVTYCAEDEVQPNYPLYCYRSIGTVTCYDRPNPNHSRSQRVGENDHNYVKKP